MTETALTGWDEYARLVLSKLEDHGAKLDAIQAEQANLRVALAELRTEFRFKSGLWGAVAGAIPGSLVILYKKFVP